jgi:uncharacterized protein YyaL (SSP411 family)
MKALHALGEQGGWPLTMFLNPDGEPFWGGTYFPPEPRYGRPGFPQVLEAVANAWRENDAAISQNAGALKAHLRRRAALPAADAADSSSAAILDESARKILGIWDMERGSFRGAPKFPNAPVLDLLWRAWLRTGNGDYRSAVLTTLTFLCQGGIYDHVGGGFARYSVDARWLVPHFEKMLYDNGLLLSLLALAFRETGSPLFRARMEETVDWLVREMQLPGGGLASSLDADTEHEEGLTYVWSRDEVDRVLGADGEKFAVTYDASAVGNWEGKIILNRLTPQAFSWLGDDEERRLQQARARLLEIRNTRPQPGRDDKVLADWNGLAISGLARAAQATGNLEAAKAAEAAFRFVADSMGEGDRLAHSCMEGTLVKPGLATDYANMIRASLDLFALTGEADYLKQGERWFTAARRHHYDAESELYRLAADDGLPLIAPSESLADEATPAATGIMVSNAASLFMLTGDVDYRDHADRLARTVAERAAADPISTASLQAGLDTLLRARLALIIGQEDFGSELKYAATGEPDPALINARSDPMLVPENHPAAGKRPKGDAALFLCNATSCLPEVSDPVDVKRVLRTTRSGLAG